MYMHVLTRFFLSFSLYSFLLLYVALHCIILCCTKWRINFIINVDAAVLVSVLAYWHRRAGLKGVGPNVPSVSTSVMLKEKIKPGHWFVFLPVL